MTSPLNASINDPYVQTSLPSLANRRFAWMLTLEAGWYSGVGADLHDTVENAREIAKFLILCGVLTPDPSPELNGDINISFTRGTDYYQIVVKKTGDYDLFIEQEDGSDLFVGKSMNVEEVKKKIFDSSIRKASTCFYYGKSNSGITASTQSLKTLLSSHFQMATESPRSLVTA